MDATRTSKLPITDVDIRTLTAYLERTGWRRTPHANSDIVLFEGPEDDEGKPIKLILPKQNDLQDSYLRLEEAINLLAVIEEKSPHDLIQSIQSKPGSSHAEIDVSRGKWWTVEIWEDEREIFKALTRHVLAFVLLIGTLVLFHKLFEFLNLPPQRQELLERIDYYVIVLALVMFTFSFGYRLVDHVIQVAKRKARASRLLKLQMERILSEEVRLSGKQINIYVEQELYRMRREATLM
jgi:hypothetical protein